MNLTTQLDRELTQLTGFQSPGARTATLSGPDGVEVDVFVGTAANGLMAAVLTDDHRRGDREIKLLYNCLPEEVYLVNGFINFNPQLLQGVLVMRRPLHLLW